MVALFEDEATVKTYRRENGHIWLYPENSSPEYQPIDGEGCSILGRVVRWFAGIHETSGAGGALKVPRPLFLFILEHSFKIVLGAVRHFELRPSNLYSA